MPADLARTRALREKIRIERDNALAEVRLRVARVRAERGVALRFSGHAHPPPYGPRRRGRRLGLARECKVAVLEFEEFHFVSGRGIRRASRAASERNDQRKQQGSGRCRTLRGCDCARSGCLGRSYYESSRTLASPPVHSCSGRRTRSSVNTFASDI